MPRSNKEIMDDIADRLARDSRINSEKIRVDITDNKVVLSGNVQSYSARMAAEEDTWSVGGVSSVDNTLGVTFPDKYKKPADFAMKGSVENLISWDPDIFLERIEVFVQEGRVILEGSVDAFWKKVRAERLASHAGGVLAVINKIVVVLTSRVSDELVGQDIVSLLSRNSALDVNKITVEVKNGQVTLNGVVPGRTGFDVAEDIARYTQGVANVENRLMIGT